MDAVVFRADCGKAIGLGHLRRCGALAAELVVRGIPVSLVASPQPQVDAAIGYWPYPVLWLPNRAPTTHGPGTEAAARSDASATLAELAKLGVPVDWVVLDHYGLGLEWQEQIRAAGYKLVVFDDLRDREHSAELIVSDSREPLPRQRTGGDHDALLGRAYAVVASRVDPPRQTVKTGVPLRCLISYGGEDPTNETTKALAALRRLQERPAESPAIGAVTAVVGPLNPRAHDILLQAASLRGVGVRIAPPDLEALIEKSDIVMTAGGGTMIEALSRGKVCIVTETALNQRLSIRELAEDGRIIMHIEEPDAAGGLAALLRLAARDHAQISARLASGPAYDGGGAARIVSEMMRISRSASGALPAGRTPIRR